MVRDILFPNFAQLSPSLGRESDRRADIDAQSEVAELLAAQLNLIKAKAGEHQKSLSARVVNLFEGADSLSYLENLPLLVEHYEGRLEEVEALPTLFMTEAQYQQLAQFRRDIAHHRHFIMANIHFLRWLDTFIEK